jgi:hypothetical protein
MRARLIPSHPGLLARIAIAAEALGAWITARIVHAAYRARVRRRRRS